MSENYVDTVYELLTGTRIPQSNDPIVENLFDEDTDIELFIASLLKICSLVGKRMYQYGVELGHK